MGQNLFKSYRTVLWLTRYLIRIMEFPYLTSTNKVLFNETLPVTEYKKKIFDTEGFYLLPEYFT